MRLIPVFYWFVTAALVPVISTSPVKTRGDSPVRRVPIARATLKVSSVLPTNHSGSFESSEHENSDVVRSDVEVFGADQMSSPHLAERIVGGWHADYRDHPYQLQLAVNGRQTCGAVIVSKWWAITAAHCLVDDDGDIVPPQALTVRAGASRLEAGGTVYRVGKVIVHKSYDDVEFDYDIALLKVEQPFHFGPTIQRVLLPQPGEGVREGALGVVTGWGLLKAGGKPSHVLQTIAVPIVSRKKCKNSYRRRHALITDRMICAGFPQANRDFCQGDSGGPLVVNGKLIGIVSWSLGCAMPGLPGVYTKVSKFRQWIREKSEV